MNKIIVAGSRSITDKATIYWCLDYFLKRIKDDCIIISGGAKGVDTIGEQWSEDRLGKQAEIYKADWDRYGKQAGMIRNGVMVDNATHLVAFWDGSSKGTVNTIKRAIAKNIKTRIIYFKKRARFGYNKKMDMFHYHVKVLKVNDFMKMIGE